MFNRIIRFPPKNSFLLFGARGTGKTLLLKERFKSAAALYIDLLDPDLNQTYSLRPRTLLEQLAALPKKTAWIIIDEIQKVPALLDVVHQQIEASDFKFALSGSSARKLKRGGANLLAGRAFVNHLFPLTRGKSASRFRSLPRWRGARCRVSLHWKAQTRNAIFCEPTRTHIFKKKSPPSKWCGGSSRFAGFFLWRRK